MFVYIAEDSINWRKIGLSQIKWILPALNAFMKDCCVLSRSQHGRKGAEIFSYVNDQQPPTTATPSATVATAKRCLLYWRSYIQCAASTNETKARSD